MGIVPAFVIIAEQVYGVVPGALDPENGLVVSRSLVEKGKRLLAEVNVYALLQQFRLTFVEVGSEAVILFVVLAADKTQHFLEMEVVEAAFEATHLLACVEQHDTRTMT